MAKVSIVIPVYNVAAYIEKCMESVMNQTMKDLEIIIVNDGTKDNSMELCQRFIQNDNRIVVINKENGGLMSAWMAGVRAATSEYVGFVDSDDWVDLDYFEKLYEQICQHEADVVVGQFLYEYSEPYAMKRQNSAVYSGKGEIFRLMDHYFMGFSYDEPLISYCRWDKLYKRDLILRNMHLFNTKVSMGEDVNTNAAVLPDCEKIVVLTDMPKYHYRINQQSIMNTYKENTIFGIVELYEALVKIAQEKKYNPRAAYAFIGNMVFEEVHTIIRQKGMSFNARKKQIRKVLDHTPAQVLSAYSELRGSKFVSVYCSLLEKGALTACMLIRMAFDTVSGAV